MAEEKKSEAGIVLTGTEQFDGSQGFLPADKAKAGGLSVTGEGQATVEEEAVEPVARKTKAGAAKKASVKSPRKAAAKK